MSRRPAAKVRTGGPRPSRFPFQQWREQGLRLCPDPPGDKDKAEAGRVFDHLSAHLTATGVIFGATVLGQGVASRPIARRLMAAYNAKGIFSNANDDPDSLRAVLAARYRKVEMEIKGSVALFSARRPMAVNATGSDLGTSASGRSSGC